STNIDHSFFRAQTPSFYTQSPPPQTKYLLSHTTPQKLFNPATIQENAFRSIENSLSYTEDALTTIDLNDPTYLYKQVSTPITIEGNSKSTASQANAIWNYLYPTAPSKANAEIDPNSPSPLARPAAAPANLASVEKTQKF